MSAPRFTNQQRRAVLAAVAGWEPRLLDRELGEQLELAVDDAVNLREQITEQLALVLGLELEHALVRYESLRMTGTTATSIVEAES